MGNYELPKNPFHAYVQTALLTESPCDTDTSFLDLDYSISNIEEASLKEMQEDLEVFMGEVKNQCPNYGEYVEDNVLASYFWYVRNGHG